MSENNMLLQTKNLKLYYQTMRGPVQAVDGVTFALERSSSLVFIGESGCGKTSLSKAILRLLPKNVAEYDGEVYFDGVNIMEYDDERFRKEIRWKKMAFIPQAAMNALNPVVKIEDQISEPMILGGLASTKEEALEKVKEALRIVGFPLQFMKRYPFELSGGMRQRAIIAMALSAKPDLVILDEPTSALDLLTQANIMNELKIIKKEYGLTYILITHDVGTASEISENVAVMYAGQIVEYSGAERFFNNPLHPYSEKLLESIPRLRRRKDVLGYIPGQPPSLINPPKGCRFAERCHKRFSKCDQEPPTYEIQGRFVKCWLYERGEQDAR
ncbi:MAG: ABC transporter ATP-binding protein [Pseudothermotoga sp.]